MRQAVNFLKHVYHESVPDIANILVAQANQDTDAIVWYLETVRAFVDHMIEDVRREGEGGRNLSADIAQDHAPSFASAKSDFLT